MSICENCQNSTEDGEYFQFYHGSIVGSNTTYSGNTTTVTTTYSIAGSEKVFLCGKCVIPRIVKNAIFNSVTILSISAIINGAIKLILGNQLPSSVSSIIFSLVTSGAIVVVLEQVANRIILPLYFQQKNNRIKIKEILFNKRNWRVGDELAIEIGMARFPVYKSSLNFFTRDRYSTHSKK